MTRTVTGCTAAAAAALLAVSCGFGFGSRRITGLASAAREGDVATIDALLDGGARLEEPVGVNGWTPLLHAVHKGQVAAAQRLLERGASVNGDIGRQALLMAVRYSHPQMVRLLLAHGVDPAADGTNGETMVHTALGGPSLDPDMPRTECSRRTEVMRALLERRPKLRVGDAIESTVVLWYTRFRGCEGLAALAEGRRLPSAAPVRSGLRDPS
jgi:hypothetical protein